MKKLQDVLSDLVVDSTLVNGLWEQNPDVLGLAFDSRTVKPGFVFFAIKGFVTDGKKYIDSAVSAGAIAVVTDSLDGINQTFLDKCLLVSDARYALAIASCRFYNNPTKDMLTIGVTGTNGKTSTCHLIKEILTEANYKVALMGTVERSYPGKKEPMEHTTQESLEIQEFLAEAKAAGADAVVLEVSSHALSLCRVSGIAFDAVVFTNLDVDHQDFYSGLEEYYAAKKLLFTDFANTSKNCIGFCNADDKYGYRLMQESKVPVYSFGLDSSLDYSAAGLNYSADGINGVVKSRNGTEFTVKSELTTKFNCYNLTAALAVCFELGVDKESIESAIEKTKFIPGRLIEVNTILPFKVYIDFAHSGTALYSVLLALKEICKRKLIVVFGAGGDKDPLRRETMGQAAAELADSSIITSDNPRTEDPRKIIDAIVGAWRAYVRTNKLEREMLVEPDRSKAIQTAISWAKQGDIVCIAGKGHETGQIVGTEVLPFDDIEEAKKAIMEIEDAKCEANC